MAGSADALALYGARPSVGAMITIKLDLIIFKVSLVYKDFESEVMIITVTS